MTPSQFQPCLIRAVVAALVLAHVLASGVSTGAVKRSGLSLYLAKYGPPVTWGSVVLKDYCRLGGFTAKICAKIKAFDGATLCAMSGDELQALALDDEEDLRRLHALIEVATSTYERISVEQMKSTVGAEEFRLESLRQVRFLVGCSSPLGHVRQCADTGAPYRSLIRPQATRLDFHTMLWALGSCPHVAMAGLRIFRPHFDDVLYGVDEADEKSPFSWPLFVLAPGTLAMRYFWAFFDTDPGALRILPPSLPTSPVTLHCTHLPAVLVLVLTLSYSLLDVVWWAQLAMLACLPYVRRSVLRTIATRFLSCIVTSTVYRLVLFPLTPALVTDAAYYVFLALAPLFTLLTLVNGASMLGTALRLRAATFGSRRAMQQQEAQRRRLAEALAQAAIAEFDDGDVDELYRIGPRLGAGGFGAAFCAQPVDAPADAPWTLALKRIQIGGAVGHVSSGSGASGDGGGARPDLADAIVKLALGAVSNNAAALETGVRGLTSTLLGSDEHFEDALARGVAELRVLAAVRGRARNVASESWRFSPLPARLP